MSLDYLPKNKVNTMAADGLASGVTRSSAALVLVLTTQDKELLVLREEGFQLHGPSQYRDN